MTGGRRFSRRIALQAPLGALAVRTFPTETAANAEVVVSAKPAAGARPFDRAGFGTVGVYDIDWLTQPNFTRLLDNLAASPGAFHRVRCFGVFTAGALENLQPTGGGKVWLDPNEPPDFSIPFAALAALVERGLTPFLALGFFPPRREPGSAGKRSSAPSSPNSRPIRASARRSRIGVSRSGTNPTKVASGAERGRSISPSTAPPRRQSRRRERRSRWAARRSPTSRS
jgi:hypothetical protein